MSGPNSFVLQPVDLSLDAFADLGRAIDRAFPRATVANHKSGGYLVTLTPPEPPATTGAPA